MIRTFRAEVTKLCTLRSFWIACALTVAIPMLLSVLNARMLRTALSTGKTDGLLSTSTVDEGFGELTYGVVGIVVLGVISISSEYARNVQSVGSSRQLSTTMTSMPHRVRLLTSKLVVLILAVIALSAVTIPLTLALSQRLLGPYATEWTTGAGWARGCGAAAYWLTMALLAFTLALLTRSAIIPLVFLIANASLVSFSLLVSRLTPAAKFLPDVAAFPAFLTESPARDSLGAKAGLIVLAAWMLAGVAVSLVTYVRRDA